MPQPSFKKSNTNKKSKDNTANKYYGKSKKATSKTSSSKTASVKANKTSSAPKMPGDWLYFNKEEISLRKIYELFQEEQTAEYWEAAGVLEISLPESGTLDFEDLEGTLGNEEDDAYLKENEIRTVAAVTIRPDDYEKAEKVMLFITEKIGGYFCADTADFTPVVKA